MPSPKKAQVETHNEHDERWGGPNPATCDDLVWWKATGMCGGCGNSDCHEGPCTSVESWHILRVCSRCPVRHAQGLVNTDHLRTPPAGGEG